MISFAGGMPDPALLPVEATQAATERVLARVGSRALQYGPSEGIPELRAHVASLLGVPMENVLITSGSQQGLDLAGRVLLDAGDRVAVQNPTYLAALSAWSSYGVAFESIAEWVQGAINAKILYAIPNFQNPTGETMEIGLRQELARLSRDRGVPLLEDDAYGDLRFEGEIKPSLLQLGGSNVLHLGTLSKVLAPGFRLGWMIAPRAVFHRFVQAKQSIDLHTSTYAQYLAWELIRSGVLNEMIPRAREVYRQKRDLMLQTLQRTMPPGVSWSRPEGGLFLFLRLPGGISGRTLARRALEERVLVVPGEEFHITGGEETLRLNFSHPTNEEILGGIEKLAAIIRQSKTNDAGVENVQNA